MKNCYRQTGLIIMQINHKSRLTRIWSQWQDRHCVALVSLFIFTEQRSLKLLKIFSFSLHKRARLSHAALLHESLGEGEKVSCGEEIERCRYRVINLSSSAAHWNHILEKQTWFAGCKPQTACDQRLLEIRIDRKSCIKELKTFPPSHTLQIMN